MRITVSNIPEGGIEEEFEIPMTVEQIELQDKVRVSLKLSKYGEKVIVNGGAAANAFLECSRCLKKPPFPVDTAFYAEYVPYMEADIEQEHELTAQEFGTDYYRADEIDIDELIMEQIFLAIPMKVLCEKDCRGMCSMCGKDLNKGNCGCTDGETDPRLEPLRKLKETFNRRKE